MHTAADNAIPLASRRFRNGFGLSLLWLLTNVNPFLGMDGCLFVAHGRGSGLSWRYRRGLDVIVERCPVAVAAQAVIAVVEALGA